MWSIVGHKWAVALLHRSLIQDRVSHAYLITGSPQIGKTTLARTFSQALNCTHPQASERPCQTCRSCELIKGNNHPDVRVIEPDGAYLKIDQIRALQHQVALSPVEGKWKIYILRQMERATTEAANALLKTLEEPPAHAVLLLTAGEAEALLPTIVSRCQPIPLRPLRRDLVEQALTKSWQVQPEQASLLARLSGGRLGWAIEAREKSSVLELRGQRLDKLVELLKQGRAERFAYAEKLSRDSDALREVMGLWLSWWRDLLLLAHNSKATLTHQDRSPELHSLIKKLKPEQACQALKSIRAAIDSLDRHVNSRLAAEVLMLNLPTLDTRI